MAGYLEVAICSAAPSRLAGPRRRKGSRRSTAAGATWLGVGVGVRGRGRGRGRVRVRVRVRVRLTLARVPSPIPSHLEAAGGEERGE